MNSKFDFRFTRTRMSGIDEKDLLRLAYDKTTVIHDVYANFLARSVQHSDRPSGQNSSFCMDNTCAPQAFVYNILCSDSHFLLLFPVRVPKSKRLFCIYFERIGKRLEEKKKCNNVKDKTYYMKTSSVSVRRNRFVFFSHLTQIEST